MYFSSKKSKICVDIIPSKKDSRKDSKNLALELILLLGLVSVLGDIAYETGRSVSGPYLAFLGAGAVTVGMISGLGEFLGYALRRAFAYGIFNTIYGAAWFVSGAVFGLLYDLSSAWLIAYVAVMEVVALLVFVRFRKAAG